MSTIKLLETKQIRSVWNADCENCFFSIKDVVATVADGTAAYWSKLKQRLNAEVNKTVTKCHGLKMPSLRNN